MKIPLFLREITDKFIRENFRRIIETVDREKILKCQFQFLELSFNSAVSNQKVAHGLSFKPKDIILTFSSGAGVVTFNNDLFDDTFLDVSTTGPCSIRCFVGLYSERL